METDSGRMFFGGSTFDSQKDNTVTVAQVAEMIADTRLSPEQVAKLYPTISSLFNEQECFTILMNHLPFTEANLDQTTAIQDMFREAIKIRFPLAIDHLKMVKHGGKMATLTRYYPPELALGPCVDGLCSSGTIHCAVRV